MTIEPLKKLVTPEQLTEMLKSIPKGTKFKGPRGDLPVGVVLHNTYHPNLAMVTGYIDSKKWTEGQLIDNWWVRYKKLAWYSGPHLFIYKSGIWVATPVDHRGTHSPSFNRNRWGIEMIGDYEKEVLPDDIKNHTVKCMARLLKHLGRPATDETLKFHIDDPLTDHKCPGKSVRDKTMWINLINKEMKSW